MRRSRRGSAAVEFALTLPLLIITFVCVTELGYRMSRGHLLAAAARDGARIGSMTIEGDEPDGSLITAAARAHTVAVMDANGLPCDGGCTVQAVWETDPISGYQFVRVTVNYPHLSLFDMLPFLEDSHISTDFSMLTQMQL